jgi:hypothetical protein
MMLWLPRGARMKLEIKREKMKINNIAVFNRESTGWTEKKQKISSDPYLNPPPPPPNQKLVVLTSQLQRSIRNSIEGRTQNSKERKSFPCHWDAQHSGPSNDDLECVRYFLNASIFLCLGKRIVTHYCRRFASLKQVITSD